MKLRIAAFVIASCSIAAAAAQILGTKPSYADRVPASFPNQQAITPRYWVPGLEEGWTPQGIALVGDHIVVSSYQDREADKPKCRVFRVERASGATSGSFEAPEPCRHAGGITNIGGGYVVLADTRQDWRIDVEKAFASGKADGATRGMIKLAKGFGSAFTFFDGKDLWNGVFVKQQDAADAKVYRLGLDVFDRDGVIVDPNVPLEIVPVPILAQGGAFDREGNLWISASDGPQTSYLYRVDRRTGAVAARYAMPPRIENLVFDKDNRLWAISESGSRKYHDGREDDFPFIFEIDVTKLR